MFCSLDVITELAEDADGVEFDVHTAAGVQHWRYTVDDAAVVAHHGSLRAVLAISAPTRLDRQWVLEFLLDRGFDPAGVEPAGLDADRDVCGECQDSLSWCPAWINRWPRLGDAFGLRVHGGHPDG